MTNVPMFIRGRVAINCDGPIDEKDITDTMDVAFIRPQMDFGTNSKVIGAAAKLIQRNAGKSARVLRGKKKTNEVTQEFNVGAYNIALMENNILSWQGPMFAGVACNPANISALNQKHPLVARVLQEISDRNVTKQDDADEDDEDEINEDGSPKVIDMTIYTQNTGT